MSLFRMAPSRPGIVITSGEPAGIGPDIIASLNPAQFDARLVVIGDCALIRSRARALGSTVRFIAYQQNPDGYSKDHIEILHRPLAQPCLPGKLDANNAAYVVGLLERGCRGCLALEFDAMVTAPVQKSSINQAGIAFTGHTEFLSNLCGVSKPVMLLTTESLRVALVTTHLPLRQVAEAISTGRIMQTVSSLDHGLRQRFGIMTPNIKVCGLNPHAGENGYLGQEEVEIISPAIKKLQQQGFRVSGPYPADTLFNPRVLSDTDAVLAMYHDQGLPVLKYAGFHQAVNTTLGLPIIRTSVDHGTALDCAGSTRANPGSLLAAIESALFQLKCRKQYV